MKKRKVVIFLIGMVMTLSLAGCSKKTSAGPEKELQTTQEQTEKDEETGQDSHSENADEAVSEESEIRFTVVQNHIETEDYYVPEEGDSFPYAFVEYSSFELPDDLKKNYPTLAQSLEEYSTDTYEYAVSTLAQAA